MFRFTIRDVLWLTALVAMGVGWWVDHRHSVVEGARWKWRFDVVAKKALYDWRQVIHADDSGVEIWEEQHGTDYSYTKDPF